MREKGEEGERRDKASGVEPPLQAGRWDFVPKARGATAALMRQLFLEWRL